MTRPQGHQDQAKNPLDPDPGLQAPWLPPVERDEPKGSSRRLLSGPAPRWVQRYRDEGCRVGLSEGRGKRSQGTAVLERRLRGGAGSRGGEGTATPLLQAGGELGRAAPSQRGRQPVPASCPSGRGDQVAGVSGGAWGGEPGAGPRCRVTSERPRSVPTPTPPPATTPGYSVVSASAAKGVRGGGRARFRNRTTCYRRRAPLALWFPGTEGAADAHVRPAWAVQSIEPPPPPSPTPLERPGGGGGGEPAGIQPLAEGDPVPLSQAQPDGGLLPSSVPDLPFGVPPNCWGPQHQG